MAFQAATVETVSRVTTCGDHIIIITHLDNACFLFLPSLMSQQVNTATPRLSEGSVPIGQHDDDALCVAQPPRF